MGETILVTGGAGFIGSQGCKLLAAAGHRPVCYDDFSSGRRDFVRYGPLVEGDVRDRGRLAAAIAEYRPTQVMHFAAKIEVEESVRRPILYHDVNLGGTIALLAACRDAGIRQFVFSSTAAVYGEPTKSPVPVSAPCAPINPYGRAKALAEQVLADCAGELGLGVTIFRYFNASGSDPEGEIGMRVADASHLIPRLLTAAAQGTAVSVFGTDYPTPDGTCVRDYVHVYDIAAAHVAAVGRPAPAGTVRTFNIGIGRGFSVREVAGSVERVTDRQLDLREGPRRAGDAASLVAGDTEQARDALGWRPRYAALDDIVAHAWGWMERSVATMPTQ